MNRTLIGAGAAVIAAASVIPYLRAIARGSTRPALTTYIVKAVVGLTLVTSYFSTGARATAWTMLVFALSAIAIVALSARRGIGHWTRIDQATLTATLVGLVLWKQTANPEIALYTSASLKWMSLAPTLVKLHDYPGTENAPSWIMALSADTLNLFALPSLIPQMALPAVNEVILSAVVVLYLLHQTAQRKGAGKGHSDASKSARRSD